MSWRACSPSPAAPPTGTSPTLATLGYLHQDDPQVPPRPPEQNRRHNEPARWKKTKPPQKSRCELLQAGTCPERLAQSKAQLAEIDAQLNEMTIIAPSDCVLEVLSVKVGDVLPANRELATLLLPQHLWVRVYVPEPWLGRFY